MEMRGVFISNVTVCVGACVFFVLHCQGFLSPFWWEKSDLFNPKALEGYYFLHCLQNTKISWLCQSQREPRLTLISSGAESGPWHWIFLGRSLLLRSKIPRCAWQALLEYNKPHQICRGCLGTLLELPTAEPVREVRPRKWEKNEKIEINSKLYFIILSLGCGKMTSL